MKKLFLSLLFCLMTVIVYSQVIVNEGFETGNNDLTPPTGWICDDDGWVCGHLEKDRNRIAHSGEWYAFATYNRDKWMYKQIDVQANNYYRLSFWYITSGIGTFNFEVKTGNAANSSSMTNTIIPMMALENEDYQSTSCTFQATSTGSLFIGFHGIADNLTWYLTIDDLIIEQTDLYNFTLEPITPDTSIFFGEYGDFRFRLINTGAETENISFGNVSGDLEDVSFINNGQIITEITLNATDTMDLIAHARVPLTGINPNESLQFNFTANSTNNSHYEDLSFNVTALQPIIQFPINEGFEDETFPPFGWQSIITNGNYNFIRAVSGEQPTCIPHNGSSAMAQYKSFYATAGKSAVLITPKLSLNATDNIVRFWMYRTDNIDNRADLINVYYSPEATTEGAELLGTIHRVITMEPIEDHNDWFEYSYNFDASDDYGFIIYEAVSDYGWNMYLDDIFVNTSIVDNNPPTVVYLNGNQEYADTDMELVLRIYDESDVPATISAEYTINNNSTTFELQREGKGNYDYRGIIPSQPNHTSGTLVFHLADVLGNESTTEPFDIHWDWQAPLLLEGFEGEQFPPEGWTREGAEQTWMQWARWGTIYYQDSDEIEYTVVPPQGEKQACLEWDFQGNVQDEHLATPLISITRPTVLTFETFAHYGQIYHDRYTVRILNTQTGYWDEVWEAADLPLWVNQYEEPVSIDLTPYIGRDIRIEWRGHNTDGTNLWYSWFIDNVKVVATDTITSVNEDFAQTAIYPNPVKDIMTIKAENNINKVTIYNICSVKVFEYLPNTKETIIDLSKLNNGIYIVEIVSNDKVAVKTIIKE